MNSAFEKDSLFYDPTNTAKKLRIKDELLRLILSGKIKSNVEGLKWVLSCGCEPNLFIEAVNTLVAQKKVAIQGKFNKQSSNIHKVEEYKIEVL